MLNAFTCPAGSIYRRLAAVLPIVAFIALPSAGVAQNVLTPESAAAVKAAYLADLDNMRGKFVGLAQAFPQDKYTWRPMEGVRSVSEVLMLIASEGYGFAPTILGGKAAMPRAEMGKLSSITDKEQVIEQLNKAFDYAKKEITAIDPSTLLGTRRAMGREMALPGLVLFVDGDMHEHLGQLIAYARMNHIVPPWSK
jgi:uncharacterized damage-inducible protein DinB